MIIGFAACLLLAFGNYAGMITGAALINIWALLDYVDGNVARCLKSSSRYGEFLDHLNTTIMSVLLFISIGVGAFLQPDSTLSPILHPILGSGVKRGILVFLGGWGSIFYFMPRTVADKYKEVFPSPEKAQSTIGVENFSRPLRILWFSMNNSIGLVMPILLLAVIFKFVGIFLIVWALIPTCAFVIITPLIAIKGRRKR